jgi:translation initiation factor IF-2
LSVVKIASCSRRRAVWRICSKLFLGTGKAKLNLILRSDVQGTAEAIKNAIMEIESEKVEANFIIAGAGAINESDVLMASSADAIILGFNVKVDGKAVKAAKAEGVQVKLYSIVYELIDQVKESMLGNARS